MPSDLIETKSTLIIHQACPNVPVLPLPFWFEIYQAMRSQQTTVGFGGKTSPSLTCSCVHSLPASIP